MRWRLSDLGSAARCTTRMIGIRSGTTAKQPASSREVGEAIRVNRSSRSSAVRGLAVLPLVLGLLSACEAARRSRAVTPQAPSASGWSGTTGTGTPTLAGGLARRTSRCRGRSARGSGVSWIFDAPTREARTNTRDARPSPVYCQSDCGSIGISATGCVFPHDSSRSRARPSCQGSETQSEAISTRRRPDGSRSLSVFRRDRASPPSGESDSAPFGPGAAWSRQTRASRNAPSRSSTRRNSRSVSCQAVIVIAPSTTSAISNDRAGAGRRTGTQTSQSAARRTVAASSNTWAKEEGTRRASGRRARPIASAFFSEGAPGTRIGIPEPTTPETPLTSDGTGA